MGFTMTRKTHLARGAMIRGEIPMKGIKLVLNKSGRAVSAKKHAAGVRAFKKAGLKPASRARMMQLSRMSAASRKKQSGGAKKTMKKGKGKASRAHKGAKGRASKSFW